MREIILKHATVFAIAAALLMVTAMSTRAQYVDAGPPAPAYASPGYADTSYYGAPASDAPYEYGVGCNCVGRGQLVRSF
jgi:hypothetical protein